MKNEVKKKMHEVPRASLYQSHTATWPKKKISTALHPGTSQSCSRKKKKQHDPPRAFVHRSRAPVRTTALALRRSSSFSILFADGASIMTVAKSSREHDQWRLSMMLSLFPVVELQ
jgi:hypothetical protein